jgi:hypothetical protein
MGGYEKIGGSNMNRSLVRFVAGVTMVLLLSLQSVAQVSTSPEPMTKGIRATIRSQGCNIPGQLMEIIGQYAEQRFGAAISRGDFRYIGISSASVDVPGISYSSALCPVSANQIQMFDGVGPAASRCPMHNSLLRSLGVFGGQYNVLMKAEREKRGMGTCATDAER